MGVLCRSRAVAAAALACLAAACGGSAPPADSPAARAARADAEAERVAASPGRKIVGRVVDVATGQGLSGVQVTAVAPGTTLTAHSGPDGSYQLLPLLPGSYDVSARYTTLAAQFSGVAVLSDVDTTLNFDLDSRPPEVGVSHRDGESRATGALEGRLVDEVTGKPFPGVVVSVLDERFRDTPFAITDDDGRYRVPGLPGGSYVVSIYYNLVDKGTIEVRRSNVVIRVGEITRVDLEIDTNTRR